MKWEPLLLGLGMAVLVLGIMHMAVYPMFQDAINEASGIRINCTACSANPVVNESQCGYCNETRTLWSRADAWT